MMKDAYRNIFRESYRHLSQENTSNYLGSFSRSMESFFTFKNHNKSSSYEKHLAPTNEDIFKKPGNRFHF